MNFLSIDSLPDDLRHQVIRRKLAVDQWLFRPRDLARSLFIIESGRLQLVRPTLGSKRSVSQSAGPGGVLGEAALFAERYGGGAIAKAPSVVWVYPKEALIKALHAHADLSETLIGMLARKIQPLAGNLELRQIKASHQRVLKYLRRIETAPEDERQETALVQFDRPFKEIAAEIGFTPETLSRALLKLERDGRITRTNDEIILHNRSVA